MKRSQRNTKWSASIRLRPTGVESKLQSDDIVKKKIHPSIQNSRLWLYIYMYMYYFCWECRKRVSSIGLNFSEKAGREDKEKDAEIERHGRDI